MPLTTASDRLPAHVDSQTRGLELHHSDLLACLETLIRDLEQASEPSRDAATPSRVAGQNAVIGVQQLFEALKTRDAATAAHSLRTTLGCAIWAERLRLTSEERDAIETAALLHDIGKLVAPVQILQKPSSLEPDEKNLLELCRHVGLEVVRQKITLPGVLEIAALAPTWYDGSRNRVGRARDDLPLGSRMLAIIDALDAMTTDQPYRKALSFEHALAELRRCAGAQFDPQLVHHLCTLPRPELQRWQETIRRHTGAAGPISTIAGNVLPVDTQQSSIPIDLFQQQVLDHLRDGVIFIDKDLRIAYWNRGASRLTGIVAADAYRSRWSPELIGMHDGRGVPLAGSECPVEYALSSGKSWSRRVWLRGEHGEPTAVEVQVTPVAAVGASPQGTAVVMRDLAPELSLRDRCLSLQQLITRDGLTQVANRAEFDRVHAQAVTNCGLQSIPYSLILADIDHFKQINDTYGHQAGDEVLKAFAKLLEKACRRGDLVARYGGEEFSVVCPGCDLQTANQRAEAMRREVAQFPQPAIEGRQITASFGICTLEEGDTPAMMIKRADKALYQAKNRGRNAVVALGNTAAIGDRRACANGQDPPLIEQEMMTRVPLPIAAEKLRGFIADHRAEILSIDTTNIQIKIDANCVRRAKRFTDRRLYCRMNVEMTAGEEETNPKWDVKASSRTFIKIAIGLLRTRDRRRANSVEQARDLMACFRSYMMVNSDEVSGSPVAPGEKQQ